MHSAQLLPNSKPPPPVPGQHPRPPADTLLRPLVPAKWPLSAHTSQRPPLHSIPLGVGAGKLPGGRTLGRASKWWPRGQEI